MREVEYAGNKYEVGRLTAMNQGHILRRLAPFLAGFAGPLRELYLESPENPTEENKKERIDKIFSLILPPLAQELQKMDNATFEYIVFSCMDAVKRSSGGGWAAVRIPGVNKFMFEDMEYDLFTDVMLAVDVIRDNLSRFFVSALAISPVMAARA